MAEANAVSPRFPRRIGSRRQPRNTARRKVAATASQRQEPGFLMGITEERVAPPKCVCSFWRSASGARSYRPARWTEERSEEHTSELQSHLNLVCRLLLEKKKKEI